MMASLVNVRSVPGKRRLRHHANNQARQDREKLAERSIAIATCGQPGHSAEGIEAAACTSGREPCSGFTEKPTLCGTGCSL
jgi:hypothetical protein